MFIKNVCLTEMCLNVIVNNLEMIVISRYIPQKSVDFLLRLYAEKVFYEYRKIKRKENENVKEDVMLWFLNPHAKEVTLHRKLFSERIVNKFQVIGTGITSLNLHRSSAPENVLNAIIRCLPCIKMLDLSETLCTNDTLSVIQETCTEIENLNLRFCKNVTDSGLGNLYGKNQSLKILDLRCSGVGAYAVFIYLKRMPLLECYKISCFTDIMKDKRDYTKLKCNLVELVYSEYDAAEVIQALTIMCPKIKRLEFESPVGKNVLEACTCFQELEMIKFKFSYPSTEVIQRLTEECPKIKKLHFESPAGKYILQACVGFQELEELKFKVLHHSSSNIRIDNFSSPILPLSFNLKALILSDLQIPTVTLVENFKNLKKLCLKKVSFTSFKEKDIKCTENKLGTLVIKDTNMEISSPSYQAIILLISVSKNVFKLDLSHNREVPSVLFAAILNSMKNLSSVNFCCTHIKMCSLIPFFDIPSLSRICANCYDDSENDAKQKLSKLLSTSFWKHMSYKDYHHSNPHDDSFDSDDDYSSDTTDEDSMNDNLTTNDSDSSMYDDVYIPGDDETLEDIVASNNSYMWSLVANRTLHRIPE